MTLIFGEHRKHGPGAISPTEDCDSLWCTEIKVRASSDGKLSDLFCWKTLVTGHHLPAILRELTVTLPETSKPIKRVSGLKISTRRSVMHHRAVTCHMSQVVEKLSTSSLWTTCPTPFEGKRWKLRASFTMIVEAESSWVTR